MKTLILAAGRFDDTYRGDIAADREPRLDMFELASVLNADLVDFTTVEREFPLVARAQGVMARSLGAALAGYRRRNRYDAILTSGEDIGLPLAALLRTSRARCSHTMIAHTLHPRKKRVFFRPPLSVQGRLDRVLVHATSEERLLREELAFPSERVLRMPYQADTRFFAPQVGVEREPDLICAAGQLHRDYDTLIEAVRGQSLRLQIAAGSPWIQKRLDPTRTLPDNVTWGKLRRFELRALYARSSLAIVPIQQNEFQTGIATILEMMAMGKCVIATRTRGQTDTIVDGETGVYVPPADPDALRAAIQRLLAEPAEAARMGNAAREYVLREASLDRFVERVSGAIDAATQERQS